LKCGLPKDIESRPNFVGGRDAGQFGLPAAEHSLARRDYAPLRYNPCLCRVEPVSALSNRVSAVETWISNIRAQRLRSKERPMIAKDTATSAAETDLSPTKWRKCRGFFYAVETADRDRTGWLGWEDSNSQMSNSKSVSEM